MKILKIYENAKTDFIQRGQNFFMGFRTIKTAIAALMKPYLLRRVLAFMVLPQQGF